MGNEARAKILIVDDDERNLLALSEVLQDIGEVVSARSGEEALRQLLKEQFAVIILDVLMPGLDGYETAQFVRAREQSRHTPIIFLTAINKEDAHLLRAYDSGAVDFVFKPFEPTAIRSKAAVFVALFEKSREIERRASLEQQLLTQRLEAQQDQMRAIEALHESEQRQALILNALPIAVYVQDGPEGALRFVAGDVAAITGFASTDFASNPSLWRERMHPEHSTHFDTIDASGKRVGELCWRHADGDYRTFVDQAVVSNADGTVAGTIRDVTEYRKMQDQLLQAQKMDAVGKLTGGIAHDFNNLLASVLGGLNLLQRRVELNERALEILNMTKHAAEQGQRLVSRLLAFSRQQSLAPQSVDLGEMTHSLNAMLSPLLGGRIALEWDIASDLWPALADQSQLELAVMNLVINARDAMPDGGTVRIAMSNRSVPSEGLLDQAEFVAIAVIDNGIGMSEEILPKIIEPFFTTKEVGKGTGLGLSMVFGFAQQSGGTLQIKSALGKGTTVEIWLPRSLDRAVDHSNHQPSQTGAQMSPEGTSVLLIDDSKSLRRLTELQLAERGYRVTTADNGAGAMALINDDAQKFDVIVTDFAMPGISGLELVKWARGIRADWPAVIITGYADTAVIAERPPDVPLITKPFEIGLLVSEIERVRGVEPGDG